MVGLTMASHYVLWRQFSWVFSTPSRLATVGGRIRNIYKYCITLYIIYYTDTIRYTLLLLLFVTSVVVGITWNYYTVFIVCFSYNCYYWLVKLLLLFGVIILVVVIVYIYIYIYVGYVGFSHCWFEISDSFDLRTCGHSLTDSVVFGCTSFRNRGSP